MESAESDVGIESIREPASEGLYLILGEPIVSCCSGGCDSEGMAEE